MFKFTTVAHPSQAQRFITFSDGSVYKDDTVTAANRVTDYIYHGPNVPAWRDKILRGENVTTELTGYRYTAKRSNGFYRFEFGGGSKSYGIQSGDLSFDPLSEAPVDLDVVNRARTQAMQHFTKQFHKKTQNWSSGVFAGELLETVRLLTNPAKSIRNEIDTLYRDVKSAIRGTKPGSSRHVKNLAGAWLEWNYAVKPLVQDLDNAAEAFRAMASGRTFDMIRIVGEGESSARVEAGVSGRQIWVPISEIPGPGGYRYVDVIDTSQVTIRGGWRNDNPSGEMPLPMRFGLGLQQAVPTAWELIPWSFFADYFSNMGDVLDAWSMRFINFAWLNMTVRNCRTATYSDVDAIPVALPARAFSNGGHAVLKRYSVTRAPMANSDWNPQIYLESPSFTGRGATKWLNVSALLAMKTP